MLVKASIIGNFTVPTIPVPMMSPTHDFAPVPPAVVPPGPWMPAIETVIPILWGPGFSLRQNKLTRNVLHLAQPLALKDHDCGYLIPHISIPAQNLKLILIMNFSSRKMMFYAATVKANGSGIALSQLAGPMVPMMTCSNPVNFPGSFPLGNVMNTVNVGMTSNDFWRGWIGIIGSVLCDTVLGALKVMDIKASWSLDRLLGKGIFTDLLGKLLGASSTRDWWIKAAFGVATGAAKIIFTGEGSMSVGIGSGYGGVQSSLERTEDGSWGFKGQGVLPNKTETISRKWKPDGTHQDKIDVVESKNIGLTDVQETKTTTVDYDKSGNIKSVTENQSLSDGRGWDQESKTVSKPTPDGKWVTTTEGAGKPPAPAVGSPSEPWGPHLTPAPTP